MPTITWLGHSTFEIAGSKTILIDPFLNDNPSAPKKADDVEVCDIVCVTHDHFDHVADAPSILKRTGATVVSTYEVATALAEEHGVKAEPGNHGGTIEIDGVKIHFVPAWHTAGKGAPVGFVIEIDGVTIYHAGDTCLFSDMALYGMLFSPDVFCVPIGDRFTMGPKSASMAVGLVKPKIALPMHYNTWPPIEQDPAVFAELCAAEAPDTEVKVLEPGVALDL
jgi:L-ascorbate metabolism protein UlaG (beta-lactamase superfamily)